VRSEPATQSIQSSELRVVAIAVLAFWGIALAVWWSALWHAEFYASFAAELPQLTATFLHGARAGAPFLVAALLSASAIHLFWRPGPSPLVRASWLLCIALAGAAIALIAITLPMAHLCGDFVPPARAAANPEIPEPPCRP